MRKLILMLMFCLIITLVYAQENIVYTGRAEDIEIDYSLLNSKNGDTTATPMGIKFMIVIEDKGGKVIAKIPQRIGAGTMTSEEIKQAIKNVVDRNTQDIWAHTQGATEAIKDKVNLEKYRSTCNSFIEPNLRTSPETIRPE